MSSVTSTAQVPLSFNVKDLQPLNLGKPQKFNFDLPELPQPPTAAERAAQLAKQDQLKVHTVFQANGKIIGNVLENGWAESRNGVSFPRNLSDDPTLRSQQIADHLHKSYPDLEVITFDKMAAPTSKDYQQHVLSGNLFSSGDFTANSVSDHSPKAAMSYDIFKALFLDEVKSNPAS